MTEPQNPANDKQPNSQPPKTLSDTDDGAILKDFIIPDIDDVTDDIDAPIDITVEPQDRADPQGDGGDLMDKDAFWMVFQTCFSIPALLIPDMRLLAIQKEEEQPARAASDATYCLLKIYYPSALMPQGKVFAHLMVAAPFFFAKAMIVREVLRARHAKPLNPPFQRSSLATKQKPAHKPEGIDFGAMSIGTGVTDNWEIEGPMQ